MKIRHRSSDIAFSYAWHDRIDRENAKKAGIRSARFLGGRRFIFSDFALSPFRAFAILFRAADHVVAMGMDAEHK